ncbi:MAG: hypothetical protein JST93_12885 [Acidobacteria bacterium]|nr:hypothetical protein [Acidobacteriota bacterium]
MTIGFDELLALRDEYGAVFVFAGQGRWFWRQGIEAYPFPDGVLIIRGDEDERRWPGAFLTATAQGVYTLHADLPGNRATTYREQWLEHLAGIVEYSTEPVTLPAWAFPPGEGDLHDR